MSPELDIAIQRLALALVRRRCIPFAVARALATIELTPCVRRA
ncbi:hypothetical protein [Enterovirga sp. CN4-39]